MADTISSSGLPFRAVYYYGQSPHCLFQVCIHFTPSVLNVALYDRGHDQICLHALSPNRVCLRVQENSCYFLKYPLCWHTDTFSFFSFFLAMYIYKWKPFLILYGNTSVTISLWHIMRNLFSPHLSSSLVTWLPCSAAYASKGRKTRRRMDQVRGNKNTQCDPSFV